MRSASQADMPGFIPAAIAAMSAGSQREGASPIDHRALGHRPVRAVEGDEIQELAVGRAADAIHSRDQRQHYVAGVVGARSARAHPWVKAGGEHLDRDLVLGARRGRLEVS